MRVKSIVAAAFAVLMIVTATAWVTAQSFTVTKVTPFEITGSDLGFRVQGLRGNTPVGVLVVKVRGEWVEAEIGMPSSRSLTLR